MFQSLFWWKFLHYYTFIFRLLLIRCEWWLFIFIVLFILLLLLIGHEFLFVIFIFMMTGPTLRKFFFGKISLYCARENFQICKQQLNFFQKHNHFENIQITDDQNSNLEWHHDAWHKETKSNSNYISNNYEQERKWKLKPKQRSITPWSFTR